MKEFLDKWNKDLESKQKDESNINKYVKNNKQNQRKFHKKKVHYKNEIKCDTKKHNSVQVNMNKCIICGKRFRSVTKDGMYCSTLCMNTNISDENKELNTNKETESNIRKCLFCNSNFKAATENDIYCSRYCIDRDTKRKCLRCGKRFLHNNLNSKFCSDKCKNEHTYKVECDNCKEIFYSKDKTKEFCSDNCINENTKRNHPGYYDYDSVNGLSEHIKTRVDIIIDGSDNQMSDIDSWLMGSNEFQLNKSKVLDRDNHECYICKDEYGLEIHHITPRSWGGGYRMDNLITLCTSCHRHIETRDKAHAYRSCLRNAKINSDDITYSNIQRVSLERSATDYKNILENIFDKLKDGHNKEALIEIANVLDDIDNNL